MRTQPSRFTRVFLFFAFFSLLTLRSFAQSTPAPSRITQAVDEAHLTLLKGNTYYLARAKYDRGAAPASLPMNRMLLVLQRSPDQEAALEQLLDQQQDHASPNFHQWLTPQQFGQQFGPSDQDIQTITSWLQSHGFQVAPISSGRTVIEFSGTAGQVQEAFHTTIHKYSVPMASGTPATPATVEDHWANSSDPSIPTALSPLVVGIDTLHNFPRKPMHVVAGVFKKDRSTGKISPANPQFTFTCGVNNANQPISCYGIGPTDFATIYNVLPLWNGSPAPVIDGTGQTIGIIGETDVDMKDIESFRSLFNLPANDPVVVLDGPDPGIVPGDETESDLDLQWSGAVAKGATIKFITSASTNTTLGVDLSAQFAVDHNVAPVLSESYGVCEAALGTAGNQFYNAVWQQAAAEGITAFVSAGDSGSAGCDSQDNSAPAPAENGLQVSGFASTPYNVAVGGTDFNDLASPSTYWNVTSTSSATELSAKSYIPEVPWNDSCTSQALAFYGFSTNALANCNNQTLLGINVFTLGGAGGKSSCTTGNGQSINGCGGGYAKPSWQTGTGVPNDSKRDIPDVSLFAATGFYTNSFYIVCEADITDSIYCNQNPQNLDFLGVGGTSASSPAFAGIMALVNQKTASRQGNANYILYQLAAKSGASCTSSGSPASTCIFYDINTGTNAMPCDDTVASPVNCGSAGPLGVGILTGYNATAGYDLATGLGSVNAANLVNKWSTVTSALKATATTLSLSPTSSIPHGTPVTVQIAVTPTPPAAGTVTGNVALFSTSAEQGVTDFALTNGSVNSTTNALPGGSYSVTAHYPGDGNFAASDSTPVAVTVTPEGSKTFANIVTLDVNGNVTSFSASAATYGSGYFLFRVDVGDSASSLSSATGISSNCSKHLEICPTGTVAITSTGPPLAAGSLPLNVEGFAEYRSLPTGSYGISASYTGDPSYQPSATTLNVAIAKAPTTATAATGEFPVQYGATEQIDGTVQTTSNGVVPTGTFAFSMDGSPLATTSMTYQAFPYQPTTMPPSYTHLDASASAVFLSLGNHTLVNQYSGDANYAAATSPPFSFNVAQAQPFFQTYGASPTSINLGQQATLTAAMYGSQHGVPPTGTMIFHDGTTAIPGTVTYTPVNSTALTGSVLQASLPYTPTSAGTHTITVTYSGDANYLSVSSPSPGATLTVVGPTFAVAANPTTVLVSSPGAAGSTTLTFSAMNGYSGTIPLSPALCAGMPPETTCSFSSSSVVLNSGTTSASTTLTFQTTAPSTAAPSRRKPPAAFGWRTLGGNNVILCLICLAILLASYHSGRRRWSTALTLLAITSLLAISSCGGGGGGNGGGGNGGGSGGGNPGTPVENDGGVVITFSGAGATPTPTLNLQIDVE